MTKNSPALLSICIPTYNRAQKLERCLTSVQRAGAPFLNKLEIVVSNNASTDETRVVLDQFQALGLPCNCIHQAENIGAEANFWFLWQVATGQYVWVLGDDDLLEEHSIRDVIDRVSQLEEDVLVLGYSRWSSDLSQCTEPAAFGRVAKRYASSSELMDEFGPELSFISCVVLRRSLLSNVQESSFRKLSPTGFSFMYAVYKALLGPSLRGQLLAGSLVKNRNATSTSYNWDNYFVVGMAQVLDALGRSGYSHRSIARAKNKVIRSFLFPKFKERRLGGENLRPLWSRLFQYHRSSWRLWIFVLPLLCVPSSLLSVASNFRDRMKHHGRAH